MYFSPLPYVLHALLTVLITAHKCQLFYDSFIDRCLILYTKLGFNLKNATKNFQWGRCYGNFEVDVEERS